MIRSSSCCSVSATATTTLEGVKEEKHRKKHKKIEVAVWEEDNAAITAIAHFFTLYNALSSHSLEQWHVYRERVDGFSLPC